MREDVIRAHAELPSLCEHIHLPLQSGSSRILRAMRRTYDRERYLDRVALIREHVPDVALTHRHHRRLPGRDRGGLRADALAGRGGRLRRSVHVPLLAAPRHRGGDAERRAGPARAEGRSGWSGSSRSSSAARASAPSASSGAPSRSWSRARAAPTPSACADARATTRSSTSQASPPPASSPRSRSTPPPARRCWGRNGCSRAQADRRVFGDGCMHPSRGRRMRRPHCDRADRDSAGRGVGEGVGARRAALQLGDAVAGEGHHHPAQTILERPGGVRVVAWGETRRARGRRARRPPRCCPRCGRSRGCGASRRRSPWRSRSSTARPRRRASVQRARAPPPAARGHRARAIPRAPGPALRGPPLSAGA